MQIITIIGLTALTINLIISNVIIIILKEKPKKLLPWLAIINIVPIGGFLIYIFFGISLSKKTQKKLIISAKNSWQTLNNPKDYTKFSLSKKQISNIEFMSNISPFPLQCADDITFFAFADDFYERLKQDIMTAKKRIWVSSYILADDDVGKNFVNLLSLKSRFKVDVKLLYDSAGSLKTSKKMFKDLKQSGGQVVDFFPPLWGIKKFNTRFNFRNHRKLIIIDDNIVYTGGLNFRNDHFNMDKKLYPWRDTHTRIITKNTQSYDAIFASDWNYEKKQKINIVNQKEVSCGEYKILPIDSAPCYNKSNIKQNFSNLISLAKNQIIIESPYFIPDEILISALENATKRNVKVIILLPKTPDKKWIHYASLSYAKDAIKFGVEFRLYDGFLHSKLMIIDNEIISIGTTNFDERSFNLNFETNTNIYSQKKTSELLTLVQKDMMHSKKFNIDDYKKMSTFKKSFGSLMRIFSSLL